MRPTRPKSKAAGVPGRRIAMVVAASLCLLVPAAGLAQTDPGKEGPGAALAVCDDGSHRDNRFDPCDAYIDANLKEQADTIKWILADITSWKTYAQQVSDNDYNRSEKVQWIVVSLSFLTTLAAAIAKVYPKLNIRGVDFAISPIILSAMIAAVTSINAFYQFDESTRMSQNMADDLDELETDIHFELLRRVAHGQEEPLDDATIVEWHERFKDIVQRYSQRETGNGV